MSQKAITTTEGNGVNVRTNTPVFRPSVSDVDVITGAAPYASNGILPSGGKQLEDTSEDLRAQLIDLLVNTPNPPSAVTADTDIMAEDKTQSSPDQTVHQTVEQYIPKEIIVPNSDLNYQDTRPIVTVEDVAPRSVQSASPFRRTVPTVPTPGVDTTPSTGNITPGTPPATGAPRTASRLRQGMAGFEVAPPPVAGIKSMKAATFAAPAAPAIDPYEVYRQINGGQDDPAMQAYFASPQFQRILQSGTAPMNMFSNPVMRYILQQLGIGAQGRSMEQAVQDVLAGRLSQ